MDRHSLTCLLASLPVLLLTGCASKALNEPMPLSLTPLARPPAQPLRVAVLTEFGDGSNVVHDKRRLKIAEQVCQELADNRGPIEFVPADPTALGLLGEADRFDAYLRLRSACPQHDTKRNPAFILLWPATLSVVFTPIGIVGMSFRGMIHEYARFEWEVGLYADPRCTRAVAPSRKLEPVEAVVTATGWGASDTALRSSYAYADTHVIAAATRYAGELDWPQLAGNLSAAKAERPPSPTTPEPLPPPGPIARRWAVIVGISRYQHKTTVDGAEVLGDLPFADDDAEAFRDALLARGWAKDHIRMLTNDDATKREVVDNTLESWLTKAGPEDLVVLFWAGHAFPDPTDPEKVYLACRDTDYRTPATGYRMDKLRDILEERQVRNVVVFADTCHAGKLITRGTRGLAVRPYIEKLKEQQSVPRGWVFLVSADADRQAVEHTSWGHGAFTYCLLAAFAGKADGFEGAGVKDGFVTTGEIKAYVTSVMPDLTQKELGRAVLPVAATRTGDDRIWNLALDQPR